MLQYESSSNYQNPSYNTRQPITNHNQTSSPAINTNTDRLTNKRQNRPSGSKIHVNNEYMYAKNEMDDVTDYLKGVSEFKKDMDEYELYGQLLAKKLRKLDERQRDIAMHEIDNIMFNAKMQSATQSRSFTSSPPPVNGKIKSPMFIAVQQQQFDDDNNITYQEHEQA